MKPIPKKVWAFLLLAAGVLMAQDSTDRGGGDTTRGAGTTYVGVSGITASVSGNVVTLGNTNVAAASSGGGGLSNYFSQVGTVLLFTNSAVCNAHTNASIIGYSTYAEAVASWVSGGAAATLYGVPTATKKGLIRLTPGQHLMSTGVVITSHINTVGAGREVTELKMNGGTTTMLTISNLTAGFYNMTINDNTNSTSGCIKVGNVTGTHAGDFNNIRVTGGKSGYSDYMIWYSTTFCGSKWENNIHDCAPGAYYFYSAAGQSNATFRSSQWNLGTTYKALTFVSGTAISPTVVEGNTFSAGSATAWAIGGIDTGIIIQNNTFSSAHATAPILAFGGPGKVIGNQINAEGGGPAISSFSSGKIIGNYIAASAGNANAIVTAAGTTGVIANNYIIGRGTGRAVYGTVPITIYMSGNTMRMPTGDVQGSSVFTNVTQAATSFKAGGTGDNNMEVPAALTD